MGVVGEGAWVTAAGIKEVEWLRVGMCASVGAAITARLMCTC